MAIFAIVHHVHGYTVTFISTVVAPPMIVMQPKNTTANVLQNVTFSFKAMGFNVTYQWRRIESDDIIGTLSNLTILRVTPSDEGQFYCTAFNKGGQITSDLATLTVNRKIMMNYTIHISFECF